MQAEWDPLMKAHKSQVNVMSDLSSSQHQLLHFKSGVIHSTNSVSLVKCTTVLTLEASSRIPVSSPQSLILLTIILKKVKISA